MAARQTEASQRAAEMVRAGASYAEAAKACGVARRTVQRACDAIGIRSTRKPTGRPRATSGTG